MTPNPGITRAYTDPLGLAKDNLRRQREALRQIAAELEAMRVVGLLEGDIGPREQRSVAHHIASALDLARAACSARDE